MTDAEWLDEVEKRCNAATPGPWREGTFNVWNDNLLMVVASTERHTYDAGEYVPLQNKNDSLVREQDDAKFIAHAREDIPRLVLLARRAMSVEAGGEVTLEQAYAELRDAFFAEGDKRKAAEAEVERLRAWVDDLQSGMYVNCVYCGHRYGPKETTPVSMQDVLKAHVEQCPKHPMSQLRAENEWLKRRLREAVLILGPNSPSEATKERAVFLEQLAEALEVEA